MRLVSIHLRNFRSHEDYTFKPSAGVTAIRGLNGAGKSTITDSFAWCLFGVKPPGVKKASALVRRGMPKGSKCEVEAVFVVDGTTYKVLRTMTRAGSAKCYVWREDEDGQYQVVSEGSAKDADREIRRILHMSPAEFFAAVHVQQDKVNDLIDSSSKSNRADVIQRLIGVSGLSESLSVASADLRGVKQALKASTFSGEELEALEAKLAEDEKRLDRLTDEVQGLDERVQAGQAYVAEKSQTYHGMLTEYETAQANRTNWSQRLSRLESSIPKVTSRVQALEEERSSLRATLTRAGGSQGDFSTIKADYDRLRAEHDRLTGQKATSASAITRAQEQHAEAEQVLAKAREHLDADYAAVLTDATACQRAVEDTRTQAEGKEAWAKVQASVRASLTSQASSLTKAREVISSGGHCPTCLQTVPDTERPLAELDEALESLRTRYREAGAEEKRLAHEAEGLRSAMSDVQRMAEAYTQAEEATAELSAARAQHKEAERALSALTAKLAAEEELYQAAKGIEDVKRRNAQVREDLLDAQETLDEQTREREELTSSLRGLPTYDEDSIAKKRDQLARAEQKLAGLRERYETKIQQKASAGQDVTNGRANVAREKKNQQTYQDMLDQSERLSASVETLTEFKQDRIDRAIPAVEAYGSELIAEFTDGQFTALSLDESFMVHVVDATGEQFSVGELSGGQKSLVAIALRLAIALMLVGDGEESLLILDEILFSLDVEKTPRVLQGIKNASHGQVVIIDHKNDAVDAVVDEVVQL